MTVTTKQLIDSGLVAPHLFAWNHSQGRYKLWRHIEYIGCVIARELAKGDARLIINLGPGSGKSELISFWTPAWFLGKHPDRRVILGTNTSDLADLYGGRVRNLFDENPVLNVTVADDTHSKAEWKTSKGGGMKSVGIGKALIGFRGHLLIIDDPYSTWADAQSPATRKAVAEWYRGTASNRLEPGGSVIVLHHRMHPNDLTDTLMKGEDGERWKVISLPSLAMENDALGRKPGEALCPERYDAAKLQAIRQEMQGMFHPMHQQDPMQMVAGGAYSHFGQHNTLDCPGFNPNLPLDISVDFNIVPGMHIILGQFDPITDQAWDYDEIHGQRMNINGACAELCRRIQAMPIKPSSIRVFGDAAGNARSVATSQTQYDTLLKGLEPTGIKLQLRYPASNPPVVARITTVNYSLRDIDGTIHYRIHPRCERLIRDYTNVQLDSKGGIDKSEPDLTHASDAAGYRIHELRGFGGPSKMPQGKFIY